MTLLSPFKQHTVDNKANLTVTSHQKLGVDKHTDVVIFKTYILSVPRV